MFNDFHAKFYMLLAKKDLEELLQPSFFSRNINDYQKPIQKRQQSFRYL